MICDWFVKYKYLQLTGHIVTTVRNQFEYLGNQMVSDDERISLAFHYPYDQNVISKDMQYFAYKKHNITIHNSILCKTFDHGVDVDFLIVNPLYSTTIFFEEALMWRKKNILERLIKFAHVKIEENYFGQCNGRITNPIYDIERRFKRRLYTMKIEHIAIFFAEKFGVHRNYLLKPLHDYLHDKLECVSEFPINTDFFLEQTFMDIDNRYLIHPSVPCLHYFDTNIIKGIIYNTENDVEENEQPTDLQLIDQALDLGLDVVYGSGQSYDDDF